MKILFFEMKDVCYNSYNYFAESLAKEFINHGHEVHFFRISEHSFDDLEELVGTKYDALIDFNSDLPRAILDDDSYLLDHIDAPFYDVVLDHPLYHHEKLKHKLKNFNVFVLDENHKNYVQKQYPHIKSVNLCFLTGQLSPLLETVDYSTFYDRPYDISFSGTYTDPEKMKNLIYKLPDFLKKNVYDIIDLLMANPSLSIEKAVEQIACNELYDYINEDFALHMESFYLADAYVRSLNRKNVIKTIDKEIENFHIFGGLWEELELKNAKVHKSVDFNLSFTTFSHSKIALNVMPNFKAGTHDRIFSGQINGAAVLTDPSNALKEEYRNNEDILYFDLLDIDNVPSIINNALNNPEMLIKIAQSGEKKALLHHSWANVYEVFNNVISNN